MLRRLLEHIFGTETARAAGSRSEGTRDSDGGPNPGEGDVDASVTSADAGTTVFRRKDEYRYSHYTDARVDIEHLRAASRRNELAALMAWCIEFAENEQLTVADIDGFGDLPTTFYVDLARLHREAAGTRTRSARSNATSTCRRHSAPMSIPKWYSCSTERGDGHADALGCDRRSDVGRLDPVLVVRERPLVARAW